MLLPKRITDGILLALGYLTALFFLVLILKSSVEAYYSDSYMKWETIGGFLLTMLLMVGLILRKKNVWQLFKIPAGVFALLIIYSAVRFPTSDTSAFTLFERPTEAFLNPVFLLLLLVLLAIVWTRKLPLWAKTVSTLLLVYCSSAFLYGTILGVGLEESFLGVDFFAKIPFYFLQPTFFAVQVVLPLGFFLLLFLAFRARKEKEQRGKKRRGKLLLGVAALVLLAVAVGLIAMRRNRVPNLLSLISPPPAGVGEASASYEISPGTNTTTRIATKDYGRRKGDESAEFYSMALSYAGSQGDVRHFNLSVKDSTGKDVLFLGTNDFEFFENDKKQAPHNVSFELGGVKTGQNVILLLDHSGSMSSMRDKLKLAAKAFIDLKGRNDKIVVVPFSDQPKPQPISDDKLLLKTQIDNMPKGGGTKLYRAILESYEMGEKLDGATTMVVMTDGEATDKTGDTIKALEQKLATKRLRIYSVGLGTAQALDEALLRDLANKGGGKYFRTENADDLKNIYQAIGAELQSKYTANYKRTYPPALLNILYPADREVIVSKVEAKVEVPNAQDALLQKLEFFVDGKKIAERAATKDKNYTVALDPSELTRGIHELKVVSTAAKGRQETEVQSFDVQPAVEFKLIRPMDGDSVGSSVPIEAELLLRTDNAFSRIEFSVDEKMIGSVSSEPLLVTWNTENVVAGTHQIRAEAILADGKKVVDQLQVRVAKAMAVRFTSPGESSELPLSTTLQIAIENERPDDRLDQVQYFAGEQEIGTAKLAPFSYEWNTSELKPGKYLIRAEATTKSGKVANTSVAAQINSGELIVDLKTMSGDDELQKTKEPAKFFFAPENVEIILDASNSMWGQLPSGSKIDIAKQVLADIVEMIPQETNVALRVYGSQSQVARGNCKDTKLLRPLSPIDRGTILKQIREITPRGKTPIAYSLEQTAGDLKGSKGASVVLLITDGLESCNGDPVAAAGKLAAQGVNTTLHVIGYDVEDALQQEDLAKVAAAGGGKFFPANSGAELTEAIVDAATVEFRVFDSQNREVLKDAVGATTHPLRVGTYRLQIDLDPPLELNPLSISSGETRRIFVQQQNKLFELTQ